MSEEFWREWGEKRKKLPVAENYEAVDNWLVVDKVECYKCKAVTANFEKLDMDKSI